MKGYETGLIPPAGELHPQNAGVQRALKFGFYAAQRRGGRYTALKSAFDICTGARADIKHELNHERLTGD